MLTTIITIIIWNYIEQLSFLKLFINHLLHPVETHYMLIGIFVPRTASLMKTAATESKSAELATVKSAKFAASQSETAKLAASKSKTAEFAAALDDY